MDVDNSWLNRNKISYKTMRYDVMERYGKEVFLGEVSHHRKMVRLKSGVFY